MPRAQRYVTLGHPAPAGRAPRVPFFRLPVSDASTPSQTKPAPSLARSSAWNALASVLTVLGRAGATVLVARGLAPEQTGLLVLGLWIVEMAALVVGLGLPSGLTRFGAVAAGRGDESELRALSAWIWRVQLALLGLGALALALSLQWGSALAVLRPLTPGFCLLLVGQGLGSLLAGRLAASQAFPRAAGLQATAAGLLVVAVGLGIQLGGVSGALWGYVIGQLPLAFGALYVLGRDQAPTPPTAPLKREVWRFALASWSAGLVSALVWSRLELAFLARSVGSEAVAQFSVALSMAGFVSQLPLLVSGALVSHFASNAAHPDPGRNQQAYASATRVLASVLFPTCFMASAAMPVLLPWLFGPAFAPAVPIAAGLAAASALNVSAVGSALIHGAGRAGFITRTCLLGGGLTIASGLLLVPWGGTVAAAASRAVVQGLMVGIGCWYIARRLHTPVPLDSLARTAVAAALAAGAIALLMAAAAPPWSLLPGLPVALGLYLWGLRQLKALTISDGEALDRWAGRLPAALAGPAQRTVRWLVRWP
ncbi:MAG: lipopolysaccharide biosynthesis protein [Candidatus Sericytochromatia bacterium]|nr:lipopolysaccharide biosynthesis protein [Candidatus Sericytochromatia bacterium]